MRNYFDLKIKGGSIAPYVIGGWVVIVILAFIYTCKFVMPAVADPLLNGDYAGSLLARILWMFSILVISYTVLFFMVKFTIGGLSLNGDSFSAEYDFKEYAKVCLKGILLCVITCFIYYPWFIAKVMRYFASSTSFRGNKLEFKGDGMTLFTYAALLVLLPMFILLFISFMSAFTQSIPLLVVFLIAFFVCIAIYYAMAAKWMMNFAYGTKRIISSTDGWHFGLFIAGQMFLCVITAGFYYPMALLRLWKYFVSRTVLGEDMVEDKFGFSMISGKNYLTILGQMLLVWITLGIYYPWAFAKIATLLMNQTYVDVIEQPSEPMPY